MLIQSLNSRDKTKIGYREDWYRCPDMRRWCSVISRTQPPAWQCVCVAIWGVPEAWLEIDRRVYARNEILMGLYGRVTQPIDILWSARPLDRKFALRHLRGTCPNAMRTSGMVLLTLFCHVDWSYRDERNVQIS